MQVEIKTLLQQPAIAYIIELLFLKKRRYSQKSSHPNIGVRTFVLTPTSPNYNPSKQHGKIKL
ncbi:MAG TPA: hypothetical protein VL095_12445 [Flavisolibacter sp.]|nr:hypothetical protein [Flavisolibacter sp.]